MTKVAKGTFHGIEESEEVLMRDALKGVMGLGLEIGCCDGYSTRVILEASLLDLLISVDPLVPDSMEPSLKGDRQRLAENTNEFGKRFLFQHKTSKDFRNNWDMRPIDFLFIDGDHNYNEVLFDYKAFYPWIKTGGMLALHDARMGKPGGAPFHPGPSRLAEESIYGRPDKWKIIGEAFSLIIAKKL